MEFAKNSINKNKLELKKEQKNRKSAEENILSLIEDKRKYIRRKL